MLVEKSKRDKAKQATFITSTGKRFGKLNVKLVGMRDCTRKVEEIPHSIPAS